MINKRGQVAIFIIIAVVIVAGVVVFFVFNSQKSSVLTRSSEVPDEVREVYDGIISCLEETTRQGANSIPYHGGYYNVPVESSIVYFKDPIPYYYLNNKILVPELRIVEDEFEKFLVENMKYCFNSAYYKDIGYKIEEGEKITASVRISDNYIKSEIHYPIIVGKDDLSYEFSDFEYEFNSNIKKLRDASEEVVNVYSKTPGKLCLTCIEDIASRNKVSIKMNPVFDSDVGESTDNIIWFFIDDINELNGESNYSEPWTFVVEQ